MKATGLSGRLKAGDDASDVRWYDRNKLPGITFPAHKVFIKKALNG